MSCSIAGVHPKQSSGTNNFSLTSTIRLLLFTLGAVHGVFQSSENGPINSRVIKFLAVAVFPHHHNIIPIMPVVHLIAMFFLLGSVSDLNQIAL
jgi:hypothetical protein